MIGDAVLGGVFFAVLLRPGEGPAPVRAVTSTTAASPAADPEQPGALEFAPEESPRPVASTPGEPTTTVGAAAAPTVAPTTVPSTTPRIAAVTSTTVPVTTPPTTAAPPPTTPPPIEAGE